MAKQNPLLDHLKNPAFQDQRSPIVLNQNDRRLARLFGGCRGNWQTVADWIAGMLRWPVTWFPDANVAFLPATEQVWEALRIAGLGKRGGVTGLSTVILAEMQEWLDDPYPRLKARAQTIKAAIDNRTWLRVLGIHPSSDTGRAIYGYTQLLGLRRSLARPTVDGKTIFGTSATAKDKTMNAINNRIGRRAQRLAIKGRDDAAKKGVVVISDELHCVMVIANAIKNGVDSIILTADEDYMEIFQKAQWFFDTHYRAWLAARHVKAGCYGSPARTLADGQGFFEGPLTLYRRPTSHLQEVLPQTYEVVSVGVVYVAPHNQIQLTIFPFERQMLGMLQTRAATDGRCTDLFGSANIHVDLGPLKDKIDGLHLGIGCDTGATRQTHGISNFLSGLDIVHAITCYERHVRC